MPDWRSAHPVSLFFLSPKQKRWFFVDFIQKDARKGMLLGTDNMGFCRCYGVEVKICLGLRTARGPNFTVPTGICDRQRAFDLA